MSFFDTNNCTTNANSSTTSMMTLDDFRRVAAQFEALKRKHLRHSAEMVEKACGVCGRKPTVTHELGETVIVCVHIWDALQRLPKAKPPTAPLRLDSSTADLEHSAATRVGSHLLGVGILACVKRTKQQRRLVKFWARGDPGPPHPGPFSFLAADWTGSRMATPRQAECLHAVPILPARVPRGELAE